MESKIFTNVGGADRRGPTQVSVVCTSPSLKSCYFFIDTNKICLIVLDKSALAVIYFCVIFGMLIMDRFFILAFSKEFMLD